MGIHIIDISSATRTLIFVGRTHSNICAETDQLIIIFDSWGVPFFGVQLHFRDCWRGGSLKLAIHIRCVGDALAFRNEKKGLSSFLARPRCRPTAWSWLASWAAAFSKISSSRGVRCVRVGGLGALLARLALAHSGAVEQNARAFFSSLTNRAKPSPTRRHKPEKSEDGRSDRWPRSR